MRYLTPKERQRYIERLKDVNKHWDSEAKHILADNILCEILTKLGYDDIVKEFQQIDKWYT